MSKRNKGRRQGFNVRNLMTAQQTAAIISGQIAEFLADGYLDPDLEEDRRILESMRDPFDDMGEVYRFLNQPTTDDGQALGIDRATYELMLLFRSWLSAKYPNPDRKFANTKAGKVLSRLLRGEEPNKVFGWKPKRGRRPNTEAVGYIEGWNLTARILYLNRERGLPINLTGDAHKESALAKVANDIGIEEWRVRKTYEQSIAEIKRNDSLEEFFVSWGRYLYQAEEITRAVSEEDSV